MTMELNTHGDFDQILDAAEALTLKRRDSTSEIAVAGARRFATTATGIEATGGHGARHDVVWQFSWAAGADLPRLGDRLVDAAGRCWTVLRVELLAGRTRLRVAARDLQIAHGLDSRVDIEVAEWDDPGAGPEIVAWHTWRPAVRARVQPLATTVDEQSDPPTSTTRHQVTFGEPLQLDHNHRLIGLDGTVYRLVEFTQAARIDALPVAVVVAEPVAE